MPSWKVEADRSPAPPAILTIPLAQFGDHLRTWNAAAVGLEEHQVGLRLLHYDAFKDMKSLLAKVGGK